MEVGRMSGEGRENGWKSSLWGAGRLRRSQRPPAAVPARWSRVASQQSKMSLGSLLTDDSSIVSPESSISMVSSSPETSISISTVFPHPGLRR